MSQKIKLVWPTVFLFLVTASLVLFSGNAEAKNPDLSFWTQNLSESAASSELGESDFAQEIEVVGSTVHVMWITHDKDVWARYKIFYRRSTDNGQTWEPKQLIYTSESGLDTDVTYKRMVVTGNTVHIAFNYKGGEGGAWYYVLGYLRSINNGVSFEPMIPLVNSYDFNDNNYGWGVLDVRVAAGNGQVTIGFRNQCNWKVDNQYYVLNSNDYETLFTRHTVYSTTTGNNWLVADLQRVGNNIYVLYTDSDFYYGLVYSNLYIACSATAGAPFASTLISVPSSNSNHKTLTLQDNHYVPKIAGVGNTVSVIWSGLNGADVLSVFYRRSTNSGSSFSDAVNLTAGVIPDGKTLQAGQETLAAQGDFVYSLFVTTAYNVYLRRSTDGGVNFLAGYQELTSTSAPYITQGWYPVIKTDPTVASGAKVIALWAHPTYVYSQDGGETFSKPELVSPYFSYGNFPYSAIRPQMAIGPDGKVHWTIEAYYYASSFGGYGDADIFYRGLSPVPAPSGVNNGLHLFSNTDDARRDNMQVRASSYLNFTSQMTGEVWVRPFPGGTWTGWSGSYIKPIFFKVEQDYTYPYSLQTWARGTARQAQVQIKTTDNTYYLNPASSTVGLVPDGVWSHLAFTYDAAGGADNFKLYLNGQLIAQMTATGNLVTGDGLFFTGYYGILDVAELRLWNVVRTQAQIAANMKRSLVGNEPGLAAYYTFKNTTKDITGHGNDGILMYMEQYIRQTILTAGAGPAIDLLLLLN